MDTKPITGVGSNHPAAGKAGIARLLAMEHDCPGLPEPGRSAKGHCPSSENGAHYDHDANTYGSFAPRGARIRGVVSRANLDVASQGDSVEEAKANLREAVELVFECASGEEVKDRLASESYVSSLEVSVA